MSSRLLASQNSVVESPSTPLTSSPLVGAPWLVAHRSMLRPNRPHKISLYGAEYVLWLDAQGQIQALPNVCPHMGASLSAGWCDQGQVVCPFHALAFDGVGRTVLPGTNKQTKPVLQPLELIVQGDFVWTYGGYPAQIPIPNILNQFAQTHDFLGIAGDKVVETDLLNMLLIMHDYNHQNGTHRPLFKIETVIFDQFDDQGLHSHAYYQMPRSQPTLAEIINNPAVLVMAKVIKAHLENFFPHLIIFHGEASIGEVKQVHVFVPETSQRTRTYALMYGKAKHPLFKLAKANILKLVDTVIEQDATVLEMMDSQFVPKLKLNNEVGMDWVRRNFASFPTVVEPNFSQPR
jgi:phenylpropionate dioxygenase-like ring-hydroxylating dioxygenase large terminal subunit